MIFTRLMMIFYDDTKELRTIHQDIHLSGGLPRSIPP